MIKYQTSYQNSYANNIKCWYRWLIIPFTNKIMIIKTLSRKKIIQYIIHNSKYISVYLFTINTSPLLPLQTILQLRHTKNGTITLIEKKLSQILDKFPFPLTSKSEGQASRKVSQYRFSITKNSVRNLFKTVRWEFQITTFSYFCLFLSFQVPIFRDISTYKSLTEINSCCTLKCATVIYYSILFETSI